MEPVIIAVGSNLGNRRRHLADAHQFLGQLSETKCQASPIYLSEPVGPSSRYFLNGIIEIGTNLRPKNLLKKLKAFEQTHGRAADAARWSARTIDLDIICFGNLVIRNDSLIIPHPEYKKRLFVLKPLHDLHPNWSDPAGGQAISLMIDAAPGLQLKQTTLSWRYGK